MNGSIQACQTYKITLHIRTTGTYTPKNTYATGGIIDRVYMWVLNLNQVLEVVPAYQPDLDRYIPSVTIVLILCKHSTLTA